MSCKANYSTFRTSHIYKKKQKYFVAGCKKTDVFLSQPVVMDNQSSICSLYFPSETQQTFQRFFSGLHGHLQHVMSLSVLRYFCGPNSETMCSVRLLCIRLKKKRLNPTIWLSPGLWIHPGIWIHPVIFMPVLTNRIIRQPFLYV